SSPVIAPSATVGATSPSHRSAATKVVVCQCPCGVSITSRSPTGQRPCVRAMFVLAQVSSTNTSRSGSRAGWAACQASRLALTAGRPCSLARPDFFSRQAQGGQPAGQGRLGDRQGEALDVLAQRQVGGLADGDAAAAGQRLPGGRGPVALGGGGDLAGLAAALVEAPGPGGGGGGPAGQGPGPPPSAPNPEDALTHAHRIRR